ncbi:MAG: hypothetical protein MRY32_01645 [Rickettsiales bacterium]|nr:hypothetical protein [Rickettsiales bacterium]
MPSHKPQTAAQITLISAFSLILVAGFYVPWLPNHFMSADVDSSWILTLHHAFAQDWRWGDDIIWHYGPLGFLFGKYYHPDTYGLSLFLHALMGIGVMATAIILWRKNPENPVIPLALAAIIILTDDVVFYLAPTFMLLNYFLLRKTLKGSLTWLLITLCVIASLTKFSYLLMCVCVFLAIEAHRFTLRKLPMLYLGSFCLIWLIAWLLCGQAGQHIPYYIRGAIELGSGFTAMASSYNPYYVPIAYIALACGWIYIQSSTATKPLPESTLFLPLALLGIVMAVAKGAFIHDNDHHIMQALGWLFSYCLITKDWFWPQCAKSKKYSFAMIALLCIGAFSLPYFNKASDEAAQMLSAFDQLSENSEALSEHANATKSERYQLFLHGLYKQRPLPKLRGTADVMRNHQAYLIAQPHKELTFTPRPVFQSYHAYTPWLAHENSAYLLKANAPDHMFVSLDSIMQHYPTIDDANAILSLWQNYEAKSITSGYLQLHKRKAALDAKKQEYYDETFEWDRSITIPNHYRDLIWAEIDIKPTLIGRLFSFLLYPPPIHMTFTLQSGYERTDRIIPNIARSGFVLNPLLDNTIHLAALYSPQRAELMRSNQLQSISIHSSWESRWRKWFYQDDITLRLSQIKIPYPKPSLTLDASQIRALQLTSALPAQEASYSHHLSSKHISLKSFKNESVVSTYNGARMRISLKDVASKSILLEATAYNAFNHDVRIGSICDVKVMGIQNGRESMTLWEEQLDNRPISKYRSTSVSLDLNELPVDTLELSITPQEPMTDNWVYWRIQDLQAVGQP